MTPPAQPESPVPPAQAESPEKPVSPAQPEPPGQPVPPAQPESPVPPSQPESPEKPVQAESPEKPVSPSQPEPPVQPTEKPLAKTSEPGDASGGASGAKEPTTPQGLAAAQGATLSVEPVEENPKPQPPYLRWKLVGPDGVTVVPGGTVTLQGSRNKAVADDGAGSQWLGTVAMKVLDNTGQPGYAGLDLDPTPGVFLVQNLVDDKDPKLTHTVAAADSDYRMRPEAVPASALTEEVLLGEAAEWIDTTVVLDAAAKVFDLTLKPVPQLSLLSSDEGSAGMLRGADGPVLTLFGADGPGVQKPYAYWSVQDSAGNLIGGATFNFGYRSGGGWTNVAVTDCVSAPDPCAENSLDRDPDPGEFLLMHRTTPFTSGNTLVPGNNYRVQGQSTGAPTGYVWSSGGTNWVTIGSANGNSGTWNEGDGADTHDFGIWALNSLSNCTSNCANLTITNVVSGGPASAADWILSAQRDNSTQDTYPFTSGQTRQLPRSSTYALSAVADPAIQAYYATTLNCTTSNATWSSSNRTVTFGGGSSTRTANCTFTHTYMTANLTISNQVVGGGPATTADWALSASRTNPDMTFNFSQGVLQAVPANATYTLSAVASPAIQAYYVTTFACTTSGGSGVSWSSPNRTVQFPASTGRGAICTFTHTYQQPATIVMMKGDIRSDLASGAVNVNSNYVVGARFGLYESDTATDPIATCEIAIAAQGCRFENVNQVGSRLWVGELPPAASTPAAANYAAPLAQITTGTSGSFTDRPYRYQTPTLAAGQSYTLPSLSDASEWGASSGRYANRLQNPQLALTCDAGVKVAIVMDLSGSVFPYRDTLRDAAKGFISSLSDQSSVALFSFGNASPRANTSNYPTLLTLTAANRTTLNTRIDGYRDATTSNQGTNWDAGMWAAAQHASSYDLVLVLTDGNPTYSGSPTNGNGNLTTFREVERAMFSANVIKKANTRIMTVGIGAGLSNYNLSAVSGPQGYAAGQTLNQTDYVVTNWEALKPLLEQFSRGLDCKADIKVTKLTSENGATAAPASGWTFTAAASAGTLTPKVPGQTTTDASGNLEWTLKFGQPNGTGTVTLTETQQAAAGWELENLVCTVNGAAREVPVGLIASITGVKVGDQVHCTFTNVKVTSATVELNKTWVIQDQDGNELGRYDGKDPALPDWLVAAPTLSKAPTPPPGQGGLQWNTAYSGFVQGEKLTIGETVSIVTTNHPGCTLVSQELTSVDGQKLQPAIPGSAAPNVTFPERTLAAGGNVFGITNTVACMSKLTLLKRVDTSAVGGALVPADFRLTAKDGETPVVGLNGSVGSLETITLTGPGQNTASVDTDTAYTLTEASANGQLAYSQLGIEKCTTVTGFGAGASCTAWAPAFIGGNSVQVGLGEHAIYRFVNQPIPPITVPLTGGMSAEMFGIWGSGLAILAMLFGAAYVSRIRRQMGVR